ncbi:NUDIX hydrolase domain-like protein [Rhodotorula diobovata]|uniref:NUDIX hydrolase domain-like protein n=1 Tax=Rhodotorula diobovata TaxID=5288 RepID=A0A5C5FYA8_9BASI|nr:NUDIX hydrolase domain-like protein [Rhodotorula diobovata]
MIKLGRDPPSDSSVDELANYGDGELIQVDASLQGSIEPLSDKSLAAINRLARYKPPPDPYPFPEGRAAVLVCLFGSRSGDNLNVLLSTRSETLRTYPGQVALPGGKMDDTDINLEATARREAFEEIGLPIDTTRIRYLTALPPFLARSMMLVTPVVCLLLDYTLKPEINPSEVSGVFSFPLEGFLTSSSTHPVFHRPHPPTVQSGAAPYYAFEDYPWFDGRRHRFHSFETSPQAVTGLTAEILIHVAMLAYAREPDFPLYAPDQRPYDLLIKRAIRDQRWDEFRQRWRERQGEKERGSKL